MVDRNGIKTLREILEIERIAHQDSFTLNQFAKWVDAAVWRARAWNISLDQRGWTYRESTKSWVFNFDYIWNTADVYNAYDRAMKGI